MNDKKLLSEEFIAYLERVEKAGKWEQDTSGRVRKGDPYSTMCFGCIVAQYLDITYSDKNIPELYDYFDGSRAMIDEMVFFGLLADQKDYALHSLLKRFGAGVNRPFGKEQWKLPPSQVMRNMLTAWQESIPQQVRDDVVWEGPDKESNE